MINENTELTVSTPNEHLLYRPLQTLGDESDFEDWIKTQSAGAVQ